MRDELIEHLHRRYDRFFPGNVAIECDDGWYGIIDTVMSCMFAHVISREKSQVWANKQIDMGELDVSVPPLVDPISIVQIKEKFGSLRIVYRGGDEAVAGIALMAEAMSEITCELCGNSGKMRYGRWLKTLCDQHHVERSLVSSD